MREITIKVYSFNELSKEVQEEVIEKHRLIHTAYSDWHQFVIEEWKGRLKEIGFLNAEICFSGFYNQGDGASFTATCDNEKIMNSMVRCLGYDYGWEYLQVRLWLELAHRDILQFSTKRIDRRYEHKDTVQYGVFEDFSGMNERMWNCFTFEKKCNLKNLENYFEYWCHTLCEKIYEDLRAECEYRESDEAVREFLEGSEYEFFEDGEISKL